ncbi:MULE transposase, conserved domain protein, partial [mine drainage metagenome]
SESTEELVPLLQEIRARFGVPVATLSDLRATLLAALDQVFPEVPRLLCGFHFLRDAGKDVLEARHTALAKMLRTVGTKAALKRVMMALPTVEPALVEELEYGYCTDPSRFARVYARRVIERLVAVKGSDGYGFPFTLRHLEFVNRCEEARPVLEKIHRQTGEAGVGEAVRILGSLLDDPSVHGTVQELRAIAPLFQALREAMDLKGERTPLSAEHRRGKEVQAACQRLIAEWERYLMAEVPGHVCRALKHLIEEYRKRERCLFFEMDGVEVPFTNNGLEGEFRRMRRTVRKRCGNRATGRQLTLRGEGLLLFQNLRSEKYRTLVFGDREVAAVFGEERAQWTRPPTVSGARVATLLEKGMTLLMSGQLPTSPYSVAG